MRGTRTRRWRELCIKASQIEPERRMAVVAELVGLLRENAYRFGPLLVDVVEGKVTRNDQPVSLTRREFQLLRYFIERAGSPVTRDELLRSVWGYDTNMWTHTVEVHVHHLRQKLERDASQPELIVTIPGIGYKFVASEMLEDVTTKSA
jgi:two-component system, OmpR family, alkaline phosphatase synthesis response regulator PhoP